MISIRYLKSWFFLDVISIIPFGSFIDNQNSKSFGPNKIVKMYRLLKMTNMSRIFRVINSKALLFRRLGSLIHLESGTKRLLFLTLVLLLL